MITDEQQEVERLKKLAEEKWPIYTQWNLSPEGQIDCQLTRMFKELARADFIRKNVEAWRKDNTKIY